MELTKFIEVVYSEDLTDPEDYQELIQKIKKQIALATERCKQKP